jgi:hypothetical protein
MPSQVGTTSHRNSQDPRRAHSSCCNCKNFSVYPNSGKVPSIAQQTILCILRTVIKCSLTETCPRLLKHSRKGFKRHNNQPAPHFSIHPIITLQAATITQYRTQTQRTATPLHQTQIRPARVFNPPNQHSFLHRQTMGNFYTWSQTREFVNITKSLNLPSHFSISSNPYQSCSFNSYGQRDPQQKSWIPYLFANKQDFIGTSNWT